MTVRDLMAELALHSPETLVIVRSDRLGFTSELSVAAVAVERTDPPIAGIPYRPARSGTGSAGFMAILIGPPETF